MPDNAAIVQRTKQMLYGHGIGEKPTLIQVPASADETNIGTTVTFSLDATELSKVVPGNVLSVVGAADSTSAYEMYVFSKDETAGTVVAMASYMGSPAVTADGDLDGAILEVGALKSEHLIFQMVESVILTFLWPHVFKFASYTVTPDLSDYQVELNANVEEIRDAYQIIAGERHYIDFKLDKNVPSSVSSTGVLAELYAIDGSDVYVKAIERYSAGDTYNEAVAQCIATGAAALTIGASRSSTDLEASSKDSQFRGQRNPSGDLWRDFITQRTAITDDLAQETDEFDYRR